MNSLANRLFESHLALRTMVQYHPSFLHLRVLPTLQSASELVAGLPQELQGKEVVGMILITCMSSADDPEEDPTVQYIHYYLYSDETWFSNCKKRLKQSEEFQFYSECMKKWIDAAKN
jgi:hypothetical protein